jgi:acyl-coenzyme A synthetase/AMP-(fatty) acid ligase
MDRMHQLRDNAFPSVRITTFGGESVPADIVERWAEAASTSVIENVYGSTETSINALYYKWNPRLSPGEVYRGSVPIGHPLPGVEALVCDEELREVSPGSTGELLLNGPLLTRGYLGDEERTRSAYISLPGRQGRFYRTGDLVRRPMGVGPIVFLGRRDNQIKVLGNRIELGEIEAVAKNALGFREVAALGWPPSSRGFDGIELFVGDTDRTEQEIFRTLGGHLPPYMMPRRIRLMEHLPLNPSGKIDRIALRTMLEGEHI